jgi:hypothetical protein
MIRRIIRMLSAAFLLGLLTCGVAFSAQPPQSGSGGSSDRSWPWLLGGYGLTIAADAHSTAAHLGHGTREVGIPYRWLPNDAVPPARLAIGAATMYALHQIHRTHPKTAKVLAIIGIGTTGYVAYHNYRINASLD